MTEESTQSQQIPITITTANSEILNSSHVNAQVLSSSSIASSSSPANETNSVKKSTSRSRLGTDEIVDETLGVCYGGEMERFFQSEVRPVYFGNK